MTITPGDLFTVTAHKLPHGPRCGDGWHCRVIGPARLTPDVWNVREVTVDGDTWQDGMSTDVWAHALRPLEVQTDLFGNPAATAR
ncbi:hypothetical protein OWR29_25465 [Actinoplanes sp. Pm04-4]|uniref:Uncharacterized protein n=1 Tax=Paractinoplanes pyxinae TaxID=2997416 RepID=A0ABT4B4F7_9ACTN|nr:hypothetical protein [Actinoplanes pyxinae]MCY1141361.1 hypothetical protein [Actinoplanes pyxinae]